MARLPLSVSLPLWLVRMGLLALAAYLAWDIRMYAIREYGRLIHEFDPWFNYRATEYLYKEGLRKFFTWFDHTSWYPLGRPVGTTIFPGMQLTSVAIKHTFDHLKLGWSLNDICVFVPTWFGAAASVLTGMLAAECSGFKSASPAGALVMAVIPAHIMRSVGGGYDNESVAVTAMVLTFYLWVRSLRTRGSWPWAFAAAAAYTYMVAAWGGYVFVINTVGAHAGLLMLLGRVDDAVYRAYTIFYVLGTAGAIQVPCVAWVPLKTLEQIGPLGVFLAYQLLQSAELLRARHNIRAGSLAHWQLRLKVVGGGGAAVAAVLGGLVQAGHFGPLSARVRGLFIKHMRTGNPLVDSVAEHQPARKEAYWHYLELACLVAPVGWLLLMWRPTHAKIFLIMYAAFGAFFSRKMSRLIILMGPIASALSGVALGAFAEWALMQLYEIPLLFRGSADAGTGADGGADKGADAPSTDADADAGADAAAAGSSGSPLQKASTPSGGKKDRKADKSKAAPQAPRPPSALTAFLKSLTAAYNSWPARLLRIAAAFVILYVIPMHGRRFFRWGHEFAMRSSQPSLIFKGQLTDGRIIKVTDYLDSYKWLKKNTPKDARVLSWWDYGYQLSGIGEKITLADGNTWNHEHIALVGRCLALPEKKAHRLIRHLADYVYVWSGGGGDDLAKSPHIARISNSVFGDICPNDPLCYTFTINPQTGQPTPRMAASLLFKLTENKARKEVTVDGELFREVYTSKFRKVRIYEVLNVSQKSKEWAMNPDNWLCDRPGSWYCPGQYPPKLPINVTKGFKTLDYKKHGWRPGMDQEDD
uniref:dolichyl-diphosphooligosaccharide--protein glycotransferase n=1 Tax=Chlamydomonas euryale TaxID=1486919 RepID=A0A7R9VFZ5_9CHLO